MRRIPVHTVFGVLALACAATAAFQAWSLQGAVRRNAAVAEAALPPAEPQGALPAPRDAPAEVRLARAGALAQAGANDAASRAYSALIGQGEGSGWGEMAGLGGAGEAAIRRHALYNLANLYLRQAAALGTAGGGLSGEALPLVELAKQRYRDLLRLDPSDWDARHNLERALRLAPEEVEAVAPEVNEPVERRRVMLRGMDPGDLP